MEFLTLPLRGRVYRLCREIWANEEPSGEQLHHILRGAQGQLGVLCDYELLTVELAKTTRGTPHIPTSSSLVRFI